MTPFSMTCASTTQGSTSGSTKCAKEHRKCWVVDVAGTLAGVVIRKEETRPEASVVKSPGQRILKLCTFIMGAQYRGEKFGEQLLKQCLWFAQTNCYDIVYVTAFPEQRRTHPALRCVRVHRDRAPG
jgi:hypothetical protein